MTNMGFQRAEHDHAIFYKWRHDGIVIVGVYVDDFVVSGQTKEAVDEFKRDLGSRFKTKDLGELSLVLGMEI